MTGLDLLVVDYHTPRDLDRLLRSVTGAEVDLSVWVGLVESPESRVVARSWFEETQTPGQVVDWVTNLGYNRALNRLGTLGDRDVIACCNSDVAFRPGAIDELVRVTLEHDDWGVVGPRQMNGQGALSAGGIFGTHDRPRHRGWKAHTGYDDIRTDAVYVAGSAVFLRRTVWDELTNCRDFQAAVHEPQPGPWLDTQHYYGDSYLSLHAQAHDYRAVYYGATTITHTYSGGRVGERDRPDKEHFQAACDLHGMTHER